MCRYYFFEWRKYLRQREGRKHVQKSSFQFLLLFVSTTTSIPPPPCFFKNVIYFLRPIIHLSRCSFHTRKMSCRTKAVKYVLQYHEVCYLDVECTTRVCVYCIQCVLASDLNIFPKVDGTLYAIQLAHLLVLPRFGDKSPVRLHGMNCTTFLRGGEVRSTVCQRLHNYSESLTLPIAFM